MISRAVGPSPGAVVRALRPRQWVKNLLVLAAPVAASSLDEAAVLGRAFGAVAVFVAAAGATYLFNDAADVAVDRAHPTKRLRPVATGEISLRAARGWAVGLALTALLVAFLTDVEFGVIIAAYLAINVAYSLGAKHWPGIELVSISSGFILRAVAGGAATNTPLSGWFVTVVCAAAVFVVAGKRSAELLRTGGHGGRPVLRYYSETGLLRLRAVAASVAVISYSLWVLRQDLAIDWLAALSLVPFTAALAFYSVAIEAGRGEDPEDIALGDRLFQLAVAGWLVVYGFGVYG